MNIQPIFFFHFFIKSEEKMDALIYEWIFRLLEKG